MTSLDILLLSDTLASWHFVDKLVETEKDLYGRAYDYVLLTGGVATVENTIGHHADAKE